MKHLHAVGKIYVLCSTAQSIVTHCNMCAPACYWPQHEAAAVQCRLWTGGLLGGKGGFGAMLRAAAKQAGNKPTR
jgi:Silencing defective 2 N-terminal ubiquitin domain